MTKKVRKSKFLASPNPPKTLLKSVPKSMSQKTCKFWKFFNICFQISTRRNLENIDFPYGKPLFLRFSPNSCFCNFHAFSVQKTYQKPFQNQVRTMKKSISKTCCFLTSFFSGFGLDFGGSWASNLEPSWLLKPQNFSSAAHFYLLKLKVFKKWRPGGLQARF